MITIDEARSMVPPMLTGRKLHDAMLTLPAYDSSIRMKPATVRMDALSDLYRLYLPSPMSTEIYAKLYLALTHSLKKKSEQFVIQQGYENHKTMQGEPYAGLIGGADSFTIIGSSGIGKSTAISKSLGLLAGSNIIEVDEPYTCIIPCLVIQCPFDCSVRGFLLEILRHIDRRLGTEHYPRALRFHATIDMLIGTVSQLALNHIGLLIVDEIQNVVRNRSGQNMIAMLTQLINDSGISICMVGTPECISFFEGAMPLARRSLGLQYLDSPCNRYFQNFCQTVFSYQYTKERTNLTPSITNWLYEHSNGLVAVVISLIHDAQEIAILEGKETLGLETLNAAYEKRLSFLHPYIDITPAKKPRPIKHKAKIVSDPTPTVQQQPIVTVAEMAATAKADHIDIVQLLKEQFAVEEVSV